MFHIFVISTGYLSSQNRRLEGGAVSERRDAQEHRGILRVAALARAHVETRRGRPTNMVMSRSATDHVASELGRAANSTSAGLASEICGPNLVGNLSPDFSTSWSSPV